MFEKKRGKNTWHLPCFLLSGVVVAFLLATHFQRAANPLAAADHLIIVKNGKRYRVETNSQSGGMPTNFQSPKENAFITDDPVKQSSKQRNDKQKPAIVDAQSVRVDSEVVNRVARRVSEAIRESKESELSEMHALWNSLMIRTRDFNTYFFEQRPLYLSQVIPKEVVSDPQLTLSGILRFLDSNELYQSDFNFFKSSKETGFAREKYANLPSTPRISRKSVLSNLRKGSSLVINSAGMVFEAVHSLFDQPLMETLNLPVSTNLYISNILSEMKQSKSKRTAQDDEDGWDKFDDDGGNEEDSDITSDIHTDRQDILIVPTEGCKRWRMYRPKIALPLEHQTFGKSRSGVTVEHTGNVDRESAFEPVLDVELRPGDLLYLPRGYPHRVSVDCSDPENPTFDDKKSSDDGTSGMQSPKRKPRYANVEPSIHLTIGVESETVGLIMRNVLMCVLGLNSAKHNRVALQQAKREFERTGVRVSEPLKNATDRTLAVQHLIMMITDNEDQPQSRRSLPLGYATREQHTAIIAEKRLRNMVDGLIPKKLRSQQNAKSDNGGTSNNDGNGGLVNLDGKVVRKALDIFIKGTNDLVELLLHKRDSNLVIGDNMNYRQDKLKELLHKTVKRFFAECKIELQDVSTFNFVA